MRAPILVLVSVMFLVASCGMDAAPESTAQPAFVMTTTTTTTTIPGSQTAVESEVELASTTSTPADPVEEPADASPSTTERAASPSTTTTSTTPPPESLALHHVAEFDPNRNAFADLASAVALAEDENRHALVIVGGDWCRLCLDLDALLEREPDLAAAFRNRFVIVKVNRSEENPNQAFMDDHPPVEWLPHLFVYNDAGELLESKDSRTLMVADETYDIALIGAFLARYPIG